jgi:flagellar biosynthesis/type III secretory pathway M-ring protein FliF/YscJ
MLYRLVLLVLSVIILAFILRGVIKDVRTRLREEVEKRKPRRHFEAVEEPKTWMERQGGRTIFRVSLPGVKSGDVHLRRFKESLEIKAHAGGKVYFKLLRIPPNSRVVSEKLEKGAYVIEISV